MLNDEQMDQSAVPRFGSFKPKTTPKPTPQEDDTQRHSQYEEHHRKHRHDERRHRHARRHSRDRSHHNVSHRERSHKNRAETPIVAIAKDEFEESDLFIVDRRGDAKNVEYGSLHRYSIPSYRRIGHGKVLGLAASAKIDRDESTDREIRLNTIDHRQRKPRLLTAKHIRGNQSKLRFVRINSDINDSTESDYIDLRSSRKRKLGSQSPQDPTTAVDYRSIEGKAKAPAPPHDEDLEPASNSEDEDVDLELQSRQQNAALSRKARAKPTHLEPWLALAEHQAKLVRPGVEVGRLTSSERRTLSDLRLAILNEASVHIAKDHLDRERLLRAMIMEGSIIWDGTKRASRWRDALTECPNSILLWTDYLNYIQDSHIGFKFDACKETFIQCLRILDTARRQVDSRDSTTIVSIQIYVLLRFTIFVRDAGYEELSIGLWQAMLEYHIRTPTRLQESSHSDRLAAFEEFWESETPRIGERDAKGWIYYDETQETATRRPSGLPRKSLTRSRLFPSFAEAESALQVFVLPASTDDDDATSDPFRCIMFSDISEILELLGDELPMRTLTDALLCFLGLPGVASGDRDSSILAWVQDPHLVSDWGSDVAAGKVLHPQAAGIQSRRETTFGIFDEAFSEFAHRFRSNIGDDDELLSFVDRLLEAIVHANPQDADVAEYYLVYKLKKSPSDAGKAAKRLLKQRPSSLRLYNAYALIEAKRGNLGKALSVWTTALSADLGSHVPEDEILLWHSRMLVQCQSDENATALKDMSSIVRSSAGHMAISGEEAGSQVRRLKARRLLEERLDHAVLSRSSSCSALIVDCLAWMEYLANENDINIALQIYHAQTSRVKRSGLPIALELIEQYKARLLKMHITRQRPFKPAVVRHELEEALRLFPSNSVLLELHAAIVAQDRLRTFIQSQTLTQPAQTSIVQWSFVIAGELRRSRIESFGSTANTVRATFSRALLGVDSMVKHSPLLWMMWLRFEHGQVSRLEGAKKYEAAQRTKQVFMDGLRSLPWVKQWVIMGMNLLSDGTLSQGELRQSYEVLVERGLRLRVDIEDIL